MRVALLIVALLTAAGLASAQDSPLKICFIPKHSPSADAIAVFERIQEAVGIARGTILLYASSDQLVNDRSGAVSIECPSGQGQEPWIVYNPDLIKGDALYFALAHETAHYLNNDSMSGEPPDKQKELRADEFAGRYLTRPPLNWTKQRLDDALNALPLPVGAQGFYPSLSERRARVDESYSSEYARLHPTVNSPPKIEPEVFQVKFLWRGMMDVDKPAMKDKSVPVSGYVIVYIDGKEVEKVGVLRASEDNDLDLSAGTHTFMFESSVTTYKNEYVRSHCSGEFVVNGTAVVHPKLSFMDGAKVGMCRIE